MLAEEVLSHPDRRSRLRRRQGQTRNTGRQLLAHRPAPSDIGPRPGRDCSGGGASVNPRRGSGRRPLTERAWPPLGWLAGRGGWCLRCPARAGSLIGSHLNSLDAVSRDLSRSALRRPSAPGSVGRIPQSNLPTADHPAKPGLTTPAAAAASCSSIKTSSPLDPGDRCRANSHQYRPTSRPRHTNKRKPSALLYLSAPRSLALSASPA